MVNVVIGAITGILSGFGVGGGSLLVLYLTAIVCVEQTLAGGINLLYFIGCAPAAIIGHVRNKMIEWKCALWCIVGGTPTAIMAALLVANMDTDLLRRLFGVFVIIVGIREWKAGKQNK